MRTATIVVASDALASPKLMPTGKVKWFSPAMGYGLILPDSGGKGVQLSYKLVVVLGKQAAQNIRIV